MNLGAGAEVGLYSRPISMRQDPDGFDHYFVDYDISVPMSLYLYNYNNSNNITDLVSWEPTAPQWWVTGFNPSYFGDVDASKQVMICNVDFSGQEEMYKGFMEAIKSDVENKKYIIADDSNYKIWFMWCEDSLI